MTKIPAMIFLVFFRNYRKKSLKRISRSGHRRKKLENDFQMKVEVFREVFLKKCGENILEETLASVFPRNLLVENPWRHFWRSSAKS